MHLTPDIRTTIETAAAKALATNGPHGVNVVPVSVVKMASTDEIYLYDFFMGKTVENLIAEPAVALTAWSGLAGVQLKATASYVTEGDRFTAEQAAMREQFPDRTLRGVLVLRPTEVYDIGAGPTAGQRLPS